MATATTAQTEVLNGKRRLPADQDPPIEHVVFSPVNWAFYEGLLALVGERRSHRITYDRGKLEIMAPSWNHEWWAAQLDRVILGVSEALALPLKCAGSTTFRREDLDRGLEPDRCYYTVNARRMVGRRELDLRVDPPPDLAIEVDFTSSSIDRLSIYAALGVPEVWRWDADGIHVYQLRAGTTAPEYTPVPQSPTFPTLPIEWLVDSIIDHQAEIDWELTRAARTWAAAGFPPAGDSPPPAVS
jgi:Uma2 family endonuclease